MDIFCTLVGTHFRGSEAKRIVNAMSNGDTVTLEPEPDNAYDSNAVACFRDGEHIGYLSRDNNAAVAAHLADDDYEGELDAEMIDRDGNKPVLRITLP